MKRILIWGVGLAVMAGTLFLTACTNGAAPEKEEVSDSNTIQTKEERQEEIASMEAEIAGMIRNERNETMDAKADRLLKRYRDYIGLNPRDSITAEYLFKSADLSVGVGRYEAAIKHLDRLNAEFPKFRKNVEMWLFKGFIYETYMNDHANAVETYQSIVERFPNHRLAEDARASIENLSMSEEELIKKFEKMNAEKAEQAESEGQ